MPVTIDTVDEMPDQESEGERKEGDSFPSLELRTISTITQGRKGVRCHRFLET